MIENFGESGHIGHGLTIRTKERIDPDSGGDVEILCGRLIAQFLEERKEILGIGIRNLVAADARSVWSLPAKM